MSNAFLEHFFNFLGAMLIVSLRGDVKEAHSVMEGRYLLLASNNDDRENYWIQENGSNAIWHWSLFWIIGNQEDRGRGTELLAIYSPDHVFNPLLARTWKYKTSNGNWTISENVLVEPGNLNFD